MLVKIEPLINPEPHSVPPLSSSALVTVPAVHTSGQLLAPDVRDATSVAASILAWDGYPNSVLQYQTVIPSLAPAKPGAQPSIINHDLVGAPSPVAQHCDPKLTPRFQAAPSPVIQYLHQNIDPICPVVAQSQGILLDLNSADNKSSPIYGKQ